MNFKGFTLNSAHQSFKDKQRNLFDELDKVETTFPVQTCTSDEVDATCVINDCTDTKVYKGEKSIFKKPEVPLRKCLPRYRTPDYQINPHKWTKYSLSDVRDEDMSETANTSAALSFLKDLEWRKELNSMNSEKDKETTVIKFNKSVLIDMSKEAESKPKFKCSKVVMPEYVIGQKIKKEKKIREKRSGHVMKQLTLTHLVEDDQDDDGNT